MDKGFTLIEMAVVLVIIALILTAIIGGQEFIESAKLRGIVTNVQTYQSAIKSFGLHYNHLPGDMPNASVYWVGEGSGNGDRKIDPDNNNEMLLFWRHLSLSGIINGNYSGNGPWQLRTNMPESAKRYSGFVGASFGMGTLAAVHNVKSNFFQLGGVVAGQPMNSLSVLTPENAEAVDYKIDDGHPARGHTMVGNGMDIAAAAQTCLTVAPIDFDFNQTEEACLMYFLMEPG